MRRKFSAQSSILLASTFMLGAGAGQAQTQSQELPLVLIEDKAINESTRGSYLERHSSSATKSAAELLSTPQSVSVVTRKQLDDQNVQSVKEALNYTAGVLSSVDTTSRYDSVFLRGFGGFGTSTRVADFLDGLKLPRGQAFALPSVDAFLLDRVDVIKGPSAILYGESSPGGLVNQLSRMPNSTPYNEIRLEAGSHGRAQAAFTTQGALDKDEKWQYSVSGIGRHSGTEYDDVDEQRTALSSAIRWQPSNATELTIHGFYQADPESGYFNSTFPSEQAPAEYQSALQGHLNIGDPAFDTFDREQQSLGYDFQHHISPDVTWNSKARYYAIDLNFQGIQIAAPLTEEGLLPRQAARSIEDAQNLALDNSLVVDIQTGGVQHQLTSGVDYQKSTSNWQYLFGMVPALDVLAPDYGVSPDMMSLIDNKQTLEQTGIYLQDQIQLGRLNAVLGVRKDWTEQTTENRLAQSTSQQSSDALSYRAGLSYQLNDGIAPFVSYSTSFEPTIGVDESGTPFDPREAEQWELGVKFEPADLNTLVTLSVFDIRQENVLTPGATPGFNVQLGEVRSRGVELEARGQLASNLEVIGALTRLDTEVTETTLVDNLGKRPQAVPEIYGSLWINYQHNQGPMDGLKLGAGARYVGDSYADDANTVRTDSYSLLDLAIGYDLSKLNPGLLGTEVMLNVSNLADKSYYSSCTYGFYCQQGQGRTFLLGVRHKW